MSALARLVPEPRLVELDHVDLAVTPEVAWEAMRHGDLARSRLVRALLAPSTTAAEPAAMRLDDLAKSTVASFRVLAEEPGREVAVGAIGKPWQSDSPFFVATTEDAFARFSEPGYAKIAWALEVAPRGEGGSRVTLELRVTTTDDTTWPLFRKYFRLIGPGTRLLRRIVRDGLARELGTPEAREGGRTLEGDDLLPGSLGQATHSLDVAATPEEIWPWLVRMAARRGGFYGHEVLGDGGTPAAGLPRTETVELAVGQMLPATLDRDGNYEVLRIVPERALVLGGLHDLGDDKQLAFASPLPKTFWQVTWAFVLEPIDGATTRLYARARAACSDDARLRVALVTPVHHFMELAQLRRLKERAEGHTPRGGWRDVAEGVVGAAGIVLDLLTPLLRHAPARWGLSDADADRAYPGDGLVPDPLWSWTQAVDIDAPPAAVWPWVAQIGADRGGFYSSHWLENLAGSAVPVADAVRPEWQVRRGDGLRLHPRMPPLEVVAVSPGSHFVVYGPPDPSAPLEKRPWAAVSWVFFVEPREGKKSRFVSRFRVSCSDDLATRFRHGPWATESVGFVMDRRMLLGVKERAERSAR